MTKGKVKILDEVAKESSRLLLRRAIGTGRGPQGLKLSKLRGNEPKDLQHWILSIDGLIIKMASHMRE